MSESSERKIKLLLLYEILQEQTDERHPMTTGKLSDALQNSGIAVSRKTLYEDIETLNRYGFEILCDKSRSDRYYVADRKKEVCFKLQFICPLTFARRYATIVETKKAKDGGEKLNQSFYFI